MAGLEGDAATLYLEQLGKLKECAVHLTKYDILNYLLLIAE